MDKLLFGVSGLPLGSGQKFNYASGIAYLKGLGLEAMELLFVRSVNVSANNREAILASKRENAFYLSAHGSYYVNLNADSPAKQEASRQRLIAAARALASVGGRSLVFHPGYYCGHSPEETAATIGRNLRALPDCGVAYRLETTGKASQFGTVAELAALCREVPHCKLCLDFSHIHARHQGSLQKYAHFAAILQDVQATLGRAALDDLHIHISGIRYGDKGERNHLPLRQSDFNYQACLKALKDFRVKGCVISEGPLVEKDALLLQRTYAKL